MADMSEWDEAKRRRYYRYLQLKKQKGEGEAAQPEEAEAGPTPEDSATGLDWAGETARAVNRGTGAAFEFAQDIVDIPIQAGKAALFPKSGQAPHEAALTAAWEQINPWGEDSEIDKQRQELIYDQAPDQLTEQKLEHPAITGVEWATETAFAPGKKVPNLITALASGTGAAGGEYAGGETGELVGGIAGAFFNPTQTIRKFLTPGDEESEKIFEFIRTNARDPDKAIETFKRNNAAGMEGTVADLADDAGLYNIEEVVPKGTAEAEQISAQRTAHQQQTIDQLDQSFGAGDVKASQGEAQQIIQSQVDQAEALRSQSVDQIDQAELQGVADIDAGVEQMQTAADATQARVTQGVPESSAASEKAAADIGELDTYLQQEYVNPAWEEFNALSEPLDGSGWRDDALSVLDELNESDRLLLKKKHPLVFELIDNWETKTVDDAGKITKVSRQIDPSEVQTVIQEIGDTYRSMDAAGNVDKVVGNLNKMGKRLRESMDNMPKNQEAGNAYRAARAASKDRFDRVTRGTMAKARSKVPEEYGKNIFVAGDKGGATAQDLLKAVADGNDPQAQRIAEQAIESVKDYVRAQAAKGKATKAWLNNHESFLQHFPDLQTEISNIVESQSVLKKTIATAKQERTALRKSTSRLTSDVEGRASRLTESVQKSDLAEFSRSPTKTIRKILAQEDGAAESFAELYRKVPDKEGFVRALGDTIKKGLTIDAVMGKKGIDLTAMNKWADIRPTLAGTIPEAQLKKLDTIISRTREGVARRMRAVQKIEAASNAIGDAFNNVTSAIIATNLPGGHSLIYGGRIRGWLKKIPTGGDRRQEALVKIIADPNKFAEMLSKQLPGNQREFNRLWNIFAGVGAENASMEEQ